MKAYFVDTNILIDIKIFVNKIVTLSVFIMCKNLKIKTWKIPRFLVYLIKNFA